MVTCCRLQYTLMPFSLTEASTVTLDVKLLGLSQRNPNNAFGAYAVWNVLINNHKYRGGSTGV